MCLCLCMRMIVFQQQYVLTTYQRRTSTIRLLLQLQIQAYLTQLLSISFSWKGLHDTHNYNKKVRKQLMCSSYPSKSKSPSLSYIRAHHVGIVPGPVDSRSARDIRLPCWLGPNCLFPPGGLCLVVGCQHLPWKERQYGMNSLNQSECDI